MEHVNQQIRIYLEKPLLFLHQHLDFLDKAYVDAMVIILGYIILAKIVGVFIDKALKRLASLTQIAFDDQLIAFIHRPVVLTIMFWGPLHVAVSSHLSSPWDFIVINGIKTMIILVWWLPTAHFIATFKFKEPHLLSDKAKIGREVFLLFRNMLRILIMVAGIIAILMVWNVSLTPLFASAGIAGIAVALAAKDSLANFFGGISIFMDRSYKVGDYIILDSGERGEVVDIGIRSTRIKTRDDVLITIPNSVMANAKIINESAPVPRFRIRVPVGVAYGTDLKMVSDLLVDIALKDPDVARSPRPRARIRRFGDSSIDFELLCWVNEPSLKGRVTHQLLMAIDRGFKEKGIEIPFPQRDIHLRDMEFEKGRVELQQKRT